MSVVNIERVGPSARILYGAAAYYWTGRAGLLTNRHDETVYEYRLGEIVIHGESHITLPQFKYNKPEVVWVDVGGRVVDTEGA